MLESLAQTLVAQPTCCRLCGGTVEFRFAGLLLNTYAIEYWRCELCGCLQTDTPYWLDDAYRTVHSATDTGMAARTIQMAQATSFLLKLAGVSRHASGLDWGGGNGLFCRMMRDQGYNFWNEDKYAEAFYCQGFTLARAEVATFDVVTSFEVFEHLPNPKAELAEIFGLKPALWLFSTQLYDKQDQSWGYLAPQTGRHVFFYTANALYGLAVRNGYRFLRGRHMHMFARKDNNPYLRSAVSRALVSRLLRGGKLAGLTASVHFFARQRHAFRHWQADSDAMKRLIRIDNPQ